MTGRELRTRVGLIDGIVETHVHAADGVGEVDEAEQADFGVVVDGDAGDIGDTRDQSLPARLRGLLLDVLFIRLSPGSRCFFLELLGLVVLRLPVDGVELHVAEVRTAVDVGVTGNRYRGGRGAVVGHADQDDGVGAGGVLFTGPQHVDLGLGEFLAVGVGAGVDADQEDVGGTVLLVAEVEATGLAQVGADVAEGEVAVRAADEHDGGDGGEDSLDRAGPELAGPGLLSGTPAPR